MQGPGGERKVDSDKLEFPVRHKGLLCRDQERGWELVESPWAAPGSRRGLGSKAVLEWLPVGFQNSQKQRGLFCVDSLIRQGMFLGI